MNHPCLGIVFVCQTGHGSSFSLPKCVLSLKPKSKVFINPATCSGSELLWPCKTQSAKPPSLQTTGHDRHNFRWALRSDHQWNSNSDRAVTCRNEATQPSVQQTPIKSGDWNSVGDALNRYWSLPYQAWLAAGLLPGPNTGWAVLTKFLWWYLHPIWTRVRWLWNQLTWITLSSHSTSLKRWNVCEGLDLRTYHCQKSKVGSNINQFSSPSAGLRRV